MSDYISRQAAFEALEKRGVSTTNISRVPIADVRENVSGKWKSREVNKFISAGYTETEYLSECSICGYMTNCVSYFCPNCGADMRGNNHD